MADEKKMENVVELPQPKEERFPRIRKYAKPFLKYTGIVAGVAGLGYLAYRQGKADGVAETLGKLVPVKVVEALEEIPQEIVENAIPVE